MNRFSLCRVAVLAIGAAAAGGCASPRLPPDLPPPEYERPALPSWSPATNVDAGAAPAGEDPPLPAAGSGGSGLGPALGTAAGSGGGGAGSVAGSRGDNLLDPARQAPEFAPE